jgi:uncharacterized protein (DUF427 family)
MLRPQPDPIRPGQESVWSFPRPALAQPCAAHVVIEHLGQILANTRRAVRVIETSHPPSYYIPPEDILASALRPARGSSLCEWKGLARYWDVTMGGKTLPRAGWSYPDPSPDFHLLKDHVAFYPAPFDRCSVDGETVIPQPGQFYGGWITSAVAGPFKGIPGSDWW